jgi:hypothetical protein
MIPKNIRDLIKRAEMCKVAEEFWKEVLLMTFILGMGVGILLTVGVSLIVANDIDKENKQF